jgi:hypothetical protein
LETLFDTKKEKTDRHFLPASDACSVGRIPYNYIADIGNFTQINYLYHKIGATHELSHQRHNKNSSTTVHPILCTPATVRLAERFYQHDLKNFGFSMANAYDMCAKRGFADEIGI